MLFIISATLLTICAPGPRDNCVVDGDTFWLAGEKVRILDIDTPETEQARCPAEGAAGERAKLRLHQLLNTGAVTMVRQGRDRDRNGRLLRIVMVNGRNVGQQLVQEGLARPFAGGRRPWCP